MRRCMFFYLPTFFFVVMIYFSIANLTIYLGILRPFNLLILPFPFRVP